jgi:hypothetical protein
MRIFGVSSKTGQGMAAFMEFLQTEIAERPVATAPPPQVEAVNAGPS